MCHVKTNKSMSVNKVILIGNVGKDPDVRYVDTNVAVATFTLATTERGYTLANGTKVPDKTEWHNIVLWRGLAEVCEKYVHKGDRLYIEGKIRTRSYDDQKGVRRYITWKCCQHRDKTLSLRQLFRHRRTMLRLQLSVTVPICPFSLCSSIN